MALGKTEKRVSVQHCSAAPEVDSWLTRSEVECLGHWWEVSLELSELML